MAEHNIWWIYITFATQKEALSVAGNLLENNLIACANLWPSVQSIYRWEGQLRSEEEVVLFAKTSAAKLDAAIAKVKDLHSYELPCIIASPVGEGYAPFLQWIAQQTSESA